MSCCPQRLLRTRLSAGLPAARTSRVLATGYSHHYRRIRPAQRYIANDASNTNSDIARGSGGITSSSNRFDFVAPNLKLATDASRQDSFGDAPLYENWSQVLKGVAESSAQNGEGKNASDTTRNTRRRRAVRAQTAHLPSANRPRRSLFLPRRRGKAMIVERPERYSFRLVNAQQLLEDIGGPPEIAPALNRHLYLARWRHLPFRKTISPYAVRYEAAQFVRVLYQEGKFQLRWDKFIGQQFKQKRRRVPFTDMDPPLIGDLDAEGKELANLLETGSQERFRQAWKALSRDDKMRHWQRMAKYLLQNRLDYLLDFLLVTTADEDTELPNFNMVADCFLYYEKYYARNLVRNGPEYRAYLSAIEVCLRPETWPSLSVRQMGARLFILRASPEAVVRAFRLAWWHRVHMRAETLLCFMKRLTAIGEVDRALGALRMISAIRQPGAEMTSEVVMRHCCKLLTHDSVVDSDGSRNFRILPRLLHLGVQPDRDMMNVVLANALKTGDRQLGSDMLQYMKNQNFELDAFTYVTLLTYAVAVEDREYVDTLLQEIESREELVSNPFVSSKVFHAHYVFTVKRMDSSANPAEVFYTMLEHYVNRYDITPLKELRILPPHYRPITTMRGRKPPPSVVSLYIMIATFLRCNRPAQKILDVYTRFRAMLAEGDELICQLARTDHTYNEFVIAFRNHPSMLMQCVKVVDDLRNGPPQSSASASAPANSRQVKRHAKPSTLTWNILLSAFVYHRKSRSVSKIRAMMAREGVRYNEETWNVVINDFANRQMIPEVAQSIQAMEEQGFSLNPYIIKAFGYVRDSKRLWSAIDALGNDPADPTSRATNRESRDDHDESELDGTNERATPLSHRRSGEAKDLPNPDEEHEALLESGLRRLQKLKSPEENQI